MDFRFARPRFDSERAAFVARRVACSSCNGAVFCSITLHRVGRARRARRLRGSQMSGRTADGSAVRPYSARLDFSKPSATFGNRNAYRLYQSHHWRDDSRILRSDSSADRGKAGARGAVISEASAQLVCGARPHPANGGNYPRRKAKSSRA